MDSLSFGTKNVWIVIISGCAFREGCTYFNLWKFRDATQQHIHLGGVGAIQGNIFYSTFLCKLIYTATVLPDCPVTWETYHFTQWVKHVGVFAIQIQAQLDNP